MSILGQVTLNGSQVSGNSAMGLVGGGIANGDYLSFSGTSSFLTLNNSRVTGNTAPNAGEDGIQNLLGTVTATNSQVNGNTSLNGGGISSGNGNGGIKMIQAEAQHRDHAMVEQVFADWSDGPLAHLPSGHFPANATWLTCAAICHNVTRAAGTLAGPLHPAVEKTSWRHHPVCRRPTRKGAGQAKPAKMQRLAERTILTGFNLQSPAGVVRRWHGRGTGR